MRGLTMKQRNKNKEEFKKRQEVINKLNHERVKRVMDGLNGIKVKSKIKIKCGIYNSLPSGIKKQLLRLCDYVNDRNAMRIQQTECKTYSKFKKLYVVYAMSGNQVVGWCNWWKDREIKMDTDHYVFFHVKTKFRKNGIGRQLFKICHKRLVKGKKKQREFFPPKFNTDPHGYFKGQDFYSKMLRLAKAKEI